MLLEGAEAAATVGADGRDTSGTLREETSVRVIFFDDMRSSTALKELLAERSDEEAFHEVRREHDRLVSGIICRDGAGEVIKSTGDGLLAGFRVPLGGVAYPEGFRGFLQPALENARIPKIRFVLDATVPPIRRVWKELVLPLEFTPCFKLLVDDIESDARGASEAQIFLSTAARRVWLGDGPTTSSASRTPS
jgi:class 3 adenylate cyclase